MTDRRCTSRKPSSMSSVKVCGSSYSRVMATSSLLRWAHVRHEGSALELGVDDRLDRVLVGVRGQQRLLRAGQWKVARDQGLQLHATRARESDGGRPRVGVAEGARDGELPGLQHA